MSPEELLELHHIPAHRSIPDETTQVLAHGAAHLETVEMPTEESDEAGRARASGALPGTGRGGRGASETKTRPRRHCLQLLNYN